MQRTRNNIKRITNLCKELKKKDFTSKLCKERIEESTLFDPKFSRKEQNMLASSGLGPTFPLVVL